MGYIATLKTASKPSICIVKAYQKTLILSIKSRLFNLLKTREASSLWKPLKIFPFIYARMP